MKIKQLAVTIALSAIAFSLTVAPLSGAELTDQNKNFLAGYEKVHHALVADDLAGAKKAAGQLGSQGTELAKSKSLDEARTAFAKLSDEAKRMVAGQPGIYVYHCPMLKKDWVQTSDKVANPYGGKDMVDCGKIQK